MGAAAAPVAIPAAISAVGGVASGIASGLMQDDSKTQQKNGLPSGSAGAVGARPAGISPMTTRPDLSPVNRQSLAAQILARR